MEAAAGSDEELMEKFFDTMELSAQDMAKRPEAGRPGRQRSARCCAAPPSPVWAWRC